MRSLVPGKSKKKKKFAVVFITKADDAMDFLLLLFLVYRLCRVLGRKKKKCVAVCLSKRYTKVPDAVFAPSL